MRQTSCAPQIQQKLQREAHMEVTAAGAAQDVASRVPGVVDIVGGTRVAGPFVGRR
ncbi:MAG: hypothetical protein ACHQ4H_15155 [Ktedonobacterales bacterium]